MPTSLPISELWIDSDKITAYLLNLKHPRGGTKAKYFLSYGFDPSRPEEMADALFFHARNEPLVSQVLTQYGTTLVFEGPIRRCPNRKTTSDVKSVWEWTKGTSVAKFITAY